MTFSHLLEIIILNPINNISWIANNKSLNQIMLFPIKKMKYEKVFKL